ncbi:MAG: hypothetical protein J5950_09685 [Clostridia bacterium]|nr:hypothetical protein [Clostridia bacterium]
MNDKKIRRYYTELPEELLGDLPEFSGESVNGTGGRGGEVEGADGAKGARSAASANGLSSWIALPLVLIGVVAAVLAVTVIGYTRTRHSGTGDDTNPAGETQTSDPAGAVSLVERVKTMSADEILADDEALLCFRVLSVEERHELLGTGGTCNLTVISLPQMNRSDIAVYSYDSVCPELVEAYLCDDGTMVIFGDGDGPGTYRYCMRYNKQWDRFDVRDPVVYIGPHRGRATTLAPVPYSSFIEDVFGAAGIRLIYCTRYKDDAIPEGASMSESARSRLNAKLGELTAFFETAPNADAVKAMLGEPDAVSGNVRILNNNPDFTLEMLAAEENTESPPTILKPYTWALTLAGIGGSLSNIENMDELIQSELALSRELYYRQLLSDECEDPCGQTYYYFDGWLKVTFDRGGNYLYAVRVEPVQGYTDEKILEFLRGNWRKGGLAGAMCVSVPHTDRYIEALLPACDEESDNTNSSSDDLDPFKLHEGKKLAITEPDEAQQRIITVYKQLYPECADRQPLLLDTEPYEGEIIFVPEEWYKKGYPAILGRHVFEQIGDQWLCAYLQNEEFRFGVFDRDFVLRSDVISWSHPAGMDCIWPCKVFEKDGGNYIAVEFYYGHQGIHSSSTVIYALPSLREVWNDSKLLYSDPQLGYDQYRFEINGDWFDIYEYEYHNGWMEAHYKESIRIDSISLEDDLTVISAVDFLSAPDMIIEGSEIPEEQRPGVNSVFEYNRKSYYYGYTPNAVNGKRYAMRILSKEQSEALLSAPDITKISYLQSECLIKMLGLDRVSVDMLPIESNIAAVRGAYYYYLNNSVVIVAVDTLLLTLPLNEWDKDSSRILVIPEDEASAYPFTIPAEGYSFEESEERGTYYSRLFEYFAEKAGISAA